MPHSQKAYFYAITDNILPILWPSTHSTSKIIGQKLSTSLQTCKDISSNNNEYDVLNENNLI